MRTSARAHIHARQRILCAQCSLLDGENRQFDGSMTVQRAGGLDRPLSSSPLTLILRRMYVHSRGIARRREGTGIIYEDRKSRSIDVSGRSRTRPSNALQHRSRRRGNTLTRCTAYDATITTITVTLVELYRANTISRVRHIRVHVCHTYVRRMYPRLCDTAEMLFFVERITVAYYLSQFITLYRESER